MGRPMFGDSPMPTVVYCGRTSFWNRVVGFFVLPVGPTRKRERIIMEGRLFDKLRRAIGTV